MLQLLTIDPAGFALPIAEIQQFIQQNYPELVPTPINDFVNGAERSDLWRVLVLHKVGAIHCLALHHACCDRHVDGVHAVHAGLGG
jgi:hypothetical protein